MSNAVVLGAAHLADSIVEKAHRLIGKLRGLGNSPWMDYPTEVDVYNEAELGDIVSLAVAELPAQVSDTKLLSKQIHYLAGLIIFAHLGDQLSGDDVPALAYQMGKDALYRPGQSAPAIEHLINIENACMSEKPFAALEELSKAAAQAKQAQADKVAATREAKIPTWTDISPAVTKFGTANPSDLSRETFAIVGAQVFIQTLIDAGYTVEAV